MNAGSLTEKVTIQQEVRAANGQGGFTTSWSDVETAPRVSANIVGMSGDEAISAGVERSVTRWRVTIRRRPEVSPRHRLLWNGLVLNIVSAMPLPNDPRAFTLMVCENQVL
jgi:SPP1 family predicted phage head-tail adaptor